MWPHRRKARCASPATCRPRRSNSKPPMRRSPPTTSTALSISITASTTHRARRCSRSMARCAAANSSQAATYVALPTSPVRLSITGEQREGAGWSLPSIAWTDGDTLTVRGRAAFTDDATLRLLDVQVHSGDLAPVRDRYLSGPLGTAGLSDLTLAGALDAQLHIEGDALQSFSVVPHGVDIEDGGAHRFAFIDLDGDLRYSRTTPVQSTLTWREGSLYELPFAPGASVDAQRRRRDHAHRRGARPVPRRHAALREHDAASAVGRAGRRCGVRPRRRASRNRQTRDDLRLARLPRRTHRAPAARALRRTSAWISKAACRWRSSTGASMSRRCRWNARSASRPRCRPTSRSTTSTCSR